LAKDLGFDIPIDIHCQRLTAASPFKELAEDQKAEAIKKNPAQTDYSGTNFSLETEELFNIFYPPRDDAVSKLTWTEPLYAGPGGPLIDYFEISYVCADVFSGAALVEQTRTFGMEPSESMISLLESFGGLAEIFKKLSLSIKMHGIVVNGISIGSSEYVAVLGLLPDFVKPIRGYLHDYISPVSSSPRYCPQLWPPTPVPPSPPSP